MASDNNPATSKSMSDMKMHSVLLLNSSGKQTDSISRRLAAQVVATLERYGTADIVQAKSTMH